ncbi:hypothetical protein RhiLY_12864 [Ceratobasidium sp. AG-Ba]|nr:hypothetical protein RhiLY_12864 [Ceratobasidium sp. AG-Ba]
MILGVQVGILGHTQTLDAFMQAHQQICDPGKTCSDLSRAVNKLVLKSEEEPDSLSWLLDSAILPQTNDRMLLRSVGGFLRSDVDFFIQALWKDRDILTYICTNYPTPGWAVLLLLLDRHIIWTRSSDQYSETDMRSEIYFEALCFRYPLLATPNENHYLAKMCSEIRGIHDNLGEIDAFMMDTAYADNVLRAYIHRLNPMSDRPAYPLELAALFTRFSLQDDMAKTNIVMGLIDAAFRWMGNLECLGGDLSMNSHLSDFCIGVFDATWRTLEEDPDEGYSSALALDFAEFCALTGGVILSPLSDQNLLLEQLGKCGKRSDSVGYVLKSWNLLLLSLRKLAYEFTRKANRKIYSVMLMYVDSPGSNWVLQWVGFLMELRKR